MSKCNKIPVLIYDLVWVGDVDGIGEDSERKKVEVAGYLFLISISVWRLQYHRIYVYFPVLS